MLIKRADTVICEIDLIASLFYWILPLQVRYFGASD